MPRGAWNKKDERQYKAVLKSCLARDGRKTKKCKSMAAAIVNKRRSAEGRTKYKAPKRGLASKAAKSAWLHASVRKGTNIQFKSRSAHGRPLRWIDATFVKWAKRAKGGKSNKCFIAKLNDRYLKKGVQVFICGPQMRLKRKS